MGDVRLCQLWLYNGSSHEYLPPILLASWLVMLRGLPCYGSVALGSECVEFHITKDRTMYGSDQAASIEHVSELVSGIRKMETILGNGVKVVYDTEKPIAKKLRKINDILF